MLKSKQLTVDHPERDAAFRKLKAEQEKCHLTIQEQSKNWNLGRKKVDDVGGVMALGQPTAELKEQQRKFIKMVNDASRELDAAKKRLREIIDELPRARSKAAAKIRQKVAPDFNALARSFLLARLDRLAPEIVLATRINALRIQLDHQRIGFGGMALPHSAGRAEPEMRQLREDVEAAVSAGILKASELPKEIQTVWGLK